MVLALLSLAAMAASPVGDSYATAVHKRLTQSGEFPRLLQVARLRQARYTSCGQAAITMAYNYANPDAPMAEVQVIEYAKQEGYYTEFRWPFTSPENMLAIAGYYAPGMRTGSVSTQEQGLAVLVEQLREGEPVIIDVPLRLDDIRSVAHFILVTGASRDTEGTGDILIHYNDPWTGEELVVPWEGSEGIWQGWKDNTDPGGSGWWLAIPPP